MPLINSLDHMVNNFVIKQQIQLPPRKLLHLFTEAGDNKIVSIVSLAGRQVVIIFFEYPGFDPHVPEKNYVRKPITAEVVAENPSYIAAFDYKTSNLLDVVQVPGEIKLAHMNERFANIICAAEFGSAANSLISFSFSPAEFKFIQIHPPMDIGSSKINNIEMKYINLSESSTDSRIPDGRLIIYCSEKYVYERNILITFNHSTNPDMWQFHKKAIVRGVAVDIITYTHTDFFAGKDIEIDIPYNVQRERQNTRKKNNEPEIHRIVSIHMDNPNTDNIVAELYRTYISSLPSLSSGVNISRNYYTLHTDGRLDLVNFDFGRLPARSIHRHLEIIEHLIGQYNYPDAKGGIEIIYETWIEDEQPRNQDLMFGGSNITVKNNAREYQLQPGNILKYAFMKFIFRKPNYIFELPQHNNIIIQLGRYTKCKYSPDGRYLALLIKSDAYRNKYNINGIMLYSKHGGIWHEASYIALEQEINYFVFIAETDKEGQHVGYNMMINSGSQLKFPKYTIINTPSVLAVKYSELLATAMPQLGHNNIRTIARFIAADKARYIDLTPKDKHWYKGGYYINNAYANKNKINI